MDMTDWYNQRQFGRWTAASLMMHFWWYKSQLFFENWTLQAVDTTTVQLGKKSSINLTVAVVLLQAFKANLTNYVKTVPICFISLPHTQDNFRAKCIYCQQLADKTMRTVENKLHQLVKETYHLFLIEWYSAQAMTNCFKESQKNDKTCRWANLETFVIDF